MKFSCPKCYQRLEIDDGAAGQEIICPTCGQIAVVSKADPPQAGIQDPLRSSEGTNTQPDPLVESVNRFAQPTQFNHSDSLLRCRCNHCPGVIEFARESCGTEVECPHCGLITIPYHGTAPAVSGEDPKGEDRGLMTPSKLLPRASPMPKRTAVLGLIAATLTLVVVVTAVRGVMGRAIDSLGYAITDKLYIPHDIKAHNGVLLARAPREKFLVLQVRMNSKYLTAPQKAPSPTNENSSSFFPKQTLSYKASDFELSISNTRIIPGRWISLPGESALNQSTYAKDWSGFVMGCDWSIVILDKGIIYKNELSPSLMYKNELNPITKVSIAWAISTNDCSPPFAFRFKNSRLIVVPDVRLVLPEVYEHFEFPEFEMPSINWKSPF